MVFKIHARQRKVLKLLNSLSKFENLDSLKFLQDNILEVPMESFYSEKKPYGCSVCNYSCSNKFDLVKHVESIHKGNKSYHGSLCTNTR